MPPALPSNAAAPGDFTDRAEAKKTPDTVTIAHARAWAKRALLWPMHRWALWRLAPVIRAILRWGGMTNA
jgi:hypothetical protein